MTMAEVESNSPVTLLRDFAAGGATVAFAGPAKVVAALAAFAASSSHEPPYEPRMRTLFASSTAAVRTGASARRIVVVKFKTNLLWA